MPYKFNVFTGTLDIVNASGSGGGVIGIAPTTPTAIARWVDVNATTIENSEATIQDSGAIEAQGFITQQNVVGIVNVNANETWLAPALNITLTGSINVALDGQVRII
jgi:hypothetical protein